MQLKTSEIRLGAYRFTADICGPEAGPLVLLLHGFPQTRHTWRSELPALAAAGFRAVAPDQRGYSPGARPKNISDYAIDALVQDVLDLATACGSQQFHLVGHDWGGQIAWCVAAHHRERVLTLSVVSRPHPAAFIWAMEQDPDQPERSKHHRSFLQPEATDWLAANGGKRLRNLLLNARVPPADAAAYMDVLRDRESIDAALNWYRARGKSGLGLAELPAVTMPTLFVWGDADQTVGRLAAEATARYVNAPYRFVELPGLGHFVTDEAPHAFAPLLLDNLERRAP